MRKMGFSQMSGAAGAAASTMLSSKYGYGFEAGSYLWAGFGMYTQLWAMHLSFISFACLHRVVETGKGRLAAVFACSAMVLTHLIYAYMIGMAAIVLFLYGLNRLNIKARMLRLALAALPALAITSYFWLPFLFYRPYLGASPYLEGWKYNSFGSADILFSLVNGDLLDFNGLPSLTILLALGMASAFFTKTRLARLTFILFAIFICLFFGRFTWGKLTDLLPMHDGLLFHRFIGGVHLFSILLIGMGGEWIWNIFSFVAGWRQSFIAGLILMTLMTPAVKRHYEYCDQNRQWMERTQTALDSDQDARRIIARLKDLPPGRVYAGLRENWGKQLKIGDLNFYDLLTFNRVEAFSPPYPGFSLNSDLIWHFEDRRYAFYRLFDVRYVVAPGTLKMPAFFQPVYDANRYRLYKIDTGGRSQFVELADAAYTESQASLLSMNLTWLAGSGPEENKFIAYGYREKIGKVEIDADLKGKTVLAGQGKISGEKILPGRIDLKVWSPEPATLVLKMTFHPNWRILVDQREVKPFMVSPSFIGFHIPGGNHSVHAEYRSPVFKMILMIFGVSTLAASVLYGFKPAAFAIASRAGSGWPHAE
jgi:hypothetical protein